MPLSNPADSAMVVAEKEQDKPMCSDLKNKAKYVYYRCKASGFIDEKLCTSQMQEAMLHEKRRVMMTRLLLQQYM
ncbi:MAG: hypothetical protein GXY64_03025 [Bacteroidales bacterium]|nr:hypothetical protein [Bacteroidales bacterium]